MEIANSKIANDWFYNGGGPPPGGVPADIKGLSQEQISDLVKAGAQILGGVIQNRAAMNAASGCNKPWVPENFLNRGNWSTYKKCIAAAGVVPPPATTTTPPPEKEKKFFSTTAGKATIGGIVGIVLILGAVIAYKKFKK